MIVSEEQARALWCPMARVSDPHGPGAAINRGLGDVETGPNGEAVPDRSANCMASDCMAWIPSHTRGKGSCGLARL